MIAVMRQSLLVVCSAAFAALTPPRAQAQQLNFLKITNPQEDSKYVAGATMSAGVLQVDPKRETQGLALRVRLYRNDFVIAQETLDRLKEEAFDNQKKKLVFNANLTLPKDAAGEYLLRVD